MKANVQVVRFVLSCLTVNMALNLSAAPPVISYQPPNQTVILYQQAAFGVIASGTPPLSYQWRKDGVPMVGATNDQIVLAHAQFSDAGLYSVIVSNAESSAISADAVLSVNVPKAGDLDYSFDSSISASSIVGGAYSVAVQTDDKILIAGSFTNVNGTIRGRVARLNVDGTTDFSFMNGLSGANNRVFFLMVQSDGKVLIGGDFTAVNGEARNRIARLNGNGDLDTSFLTVFSEQYLVDMKLQSDGKIVLVGFSFVNGGWRNKITRLNPDGSLDTNFLRLFSGADQPIYSVAVQIDGKVIIGGFFNSVNGVTIFGLARLNGDGSLDTNFLRGLSGPSSGLSSVSLQSDNKIVVLGDFSVINGSSSPFIGRLNADGSLDTDFLEGLSGPNSEISSIAVQNDGKVLIGGYFTTVNGAPVAYVARLWGSADIPPLIKSISQSGGDVNVSWDAIPNRTYRVQYKGNLSETNWTILDWDVLATGATASKMDTNLSGASQRFYRVQLVP